jgi:transketolase
MRTTFIKTLSEIASANEKVVLLTADLGYTVLEEFADRNPKQFYNVGVAEQNMLGVATGLAESGFIPFVYSIATFATLRPYEFIRNGPILHHLPVRIVGVGGGFEYGAAGPTHHALEDIAALRVHPDMTVIAPADFAQAREALNSTWRQSGPIYYRLGKNEKKTVAGLDGRFNAGRAETVRTGKDILLIATGAIATEVSDAAEKLAAEGIECELLIVASINPNPTRDLVASLSRFPGAVTVEAHYVTGGLGSLVSEVVAENGIRCRIVRCGVESGWRGVGGSEDYLNRVNGISSDAIAARVRSVLSPS